MTIQEKKKSELIKYRINQAFLTAEEAELLFSLEKIPAAVNRIYYLVIYCLLAFALKHDFNTSKHLQLIGWFNKSFRGYDNFPFFTPKSPKWDFQKDLFLDPLRGGLGLIKKKNFLDFGKFVVYPSFIATGLIDKNFGRIVRDCYEYKKSADYDVFVNMDYSDVKLLLDEMKSSLGMAKDYLTQ